MKEGQGNFTFIVHEGDQEVEARVRCGPGKFFICVYGEEIARGSFLTMKQREELCTLRTNQEKQEKKADVIPFRKNSPCA